MPASGLLMDDGNSPGMPQMAPKNNLTPKGDRQKTRYYRDILKIAGPCLAELILVQVASMVDMIMVGRLGHLAINAVAITTQPILLLSMVFVAINIGTTSVISRYRGEGNAAYANSALSHALLSMLAVSAIVSLLGFAFAEPMVRFMGAQDSYVIEQGAAYIRFRMIGMPALALQSSITAALRACGDSRTAMLYNLAANLINVIFNYLLIYGRLGFPRMEVGGAALATSICHICGFIIAFYVILRGKKLVHFSFKERFSYNKIILGNILRIGSPSMIEQIVMRVGLILFTMMAVSLGDIQYATHQIVLNISALSFTVGQSIGMTAAPLTGQSLGRCDPERAVMYNKRAYLLLLVASSIVGATLFFFGGTIMRLYTNESEIIEAGARVLKLVGCYQPLLASQYTFTGALQGAGDTKPIAIIMFLTVLVIRPIAAYFSLYYLDLGLMGLWLATALDQIMRSSLITLRYRSGKWKTIKLKCA